MPSDVSHIQGQEIYEQIDPADENALYKVVDMARRLQRKILELEERLEDVEEVVNE